MKKAEYASENFIPEEHRRKFLDAMSTVAKLASTGKADKNGNMNYGVKKTSYLGHGSNLVETTDPLALMRDMDSEAYNEFQKIGADSSKEDRLLSQLKYLTNWYIKASKDNPTILEEYEEKSDRYLEKEVNDKKLSAHFDGIDVSSKETFLAGLRDFMSQHQNFMSGILSVELSNRFWKS